MNTSVPTYLLAIALFGAVLVGQQNALASGSPTSTPKPAQVATQPPAATNNGVLQLQKLSGIFTVTDFQTVNGVSEARGFLTAEAVDSAGGLLDIFTNTPVRMPMPLNGALTGKLANIPKDYIPPPTLSTNLCIILAVSVEFVDVTVPGLGLNVHVNQLLVAIRADKNTRLGDVLCTILGEDVGAPSLSVARLKIRLQGNQVMLEGSGPGVVEASRSVQPPSPWTNLLAPAVQALSATDALQLLITPTNNMQFFRIAPQN